MVGAARLTSEAQSIGFALFSARDTNNIFVAESDYDLRISRFLDYYNEEDFSITYSLPVSHQGKTYSIGDPSPIPFWFKDQLNVIDGDSDASDVENLPEFCTEDANSVLHDMARILGNARAGYYRERAGAWKAEEISAQFADVVEAPPIHSRYWVSRYRVAVATARDLTQPPHPIDRKLRNSAREWLRSFGSKTDLARLQGVCGEAQDAIFTQDEIKGILFGYLTHKITMGDYSDGEKEPKRSIILQTFPSGLYGYWLHNGWVKTFFPYENTKDFRETMKQELYKSQRSGNFKRSHTLAVMLFADAPPPKDVFDVIDPILRARTNEFQERKGYSFDRVFSSRSRAAEWQGLALALQEEHLRLIFIDSIMHGNGRLDLRPVEGRFGMYKHDIEELRRYAGQLRRG